jgi:putative ABC transport system ATP-binding protein
MMESPQALVVRSVYKGFGAGAQRTPVLRGVSLDVAQGQTVFLTGPSGSGKSTLLSILGCLLTPDTGSVRVLGHEVTRLSSSEQTTFRRHHLGFVFQTFHLFPTLSALDNVRLALAMQGRPLPEATRRATDLLDQVCLGHRAGLRPAQLSTGECQRVAVARALVGEPKLLFADEPTASLDAENGRVVMHLLTDLVRQRGMTLVVVTHDDRIFPFADRIIRLEDGCLTGEWAPGPTEPQPSRLRFPQFGEAGRRFADVATAGPAKRR